MAEYFPIDGWHRIHRALADDIPRLLVRLLTAEEEYACRIHGGDKPGFHH